jgi:hypothetical protein
VTIRKNIIPTEKPWKTMVVNTALYVLGKAFCCVSRLDPRIMEETAPLKEGFSFCFAVLPGGPCLCLEKKQTGFVQKNPRDNADLVIFFKNIESAFLLLTAQNDLAKGFAHHRLLVKGDIADSMILTRCLNLVLSLLYPDIIAEKVLKRVPSTPFLQKTDIRLKMYASILTNRDCPLRKYEP